MPDPIVAQDAQPADSSPATPSTDVDSLASLNETELHDFRMTGTLPTDAPSTSPADSSPAEAVEDQPASTDAPLQAASEPADPLKPKTKARMDELLAQRAAADARAERAEQKARDLEARHRQPPPDARPAASSPAPADLVRPDPAAFPYGTADEGYLEALTDYKVAATLAHERQTWEHGQQQARARDESSRVISAFEAKAAAAREKHPDFDAVAMLSPTEIPAGSAVDLYILEAPAGADILYHLQQPANAGERRRILRLGPLDQLTELVRLGDRLTTAAPGSRPTNAPPPPPTLGSRASPGDPVERAIRDDDTGAYIRAMNARDVARLKQR